jgi:hexosaminidase
LPELTEVGGQRCHVLERNHLPVAAVWPGVRRFNGGFFSRQDYIDIIKYAKARQIEVIPEIDMPAHARACGGLNGSAL